MAVAVITLVALVGACVESMVIIFVCYLVFGAGTVAAMIVSNSSTVYKVNPIDVSIIKSTPVVNPTPEVAEKVEEKKAPAKKAPAKKAPAQEEAKVEEAPVEKAAAKKTTTKKAPAKKAEAKPEEKAE